MQLSVPTLPTDPIACASPANVMSSSSAALNTNATLSTDFGALLTAQAPTSKPAASPDTILASTASASTSVVAQSDENLSLGDDIDSSNTETEPPASTTDDVLGQTSVLGCLMASILPVADANAAPVPSVNVLEANSTTPSTTERTTDSGVPTSPSSPSSSANGRGNVVSAGVARGRPFVGGTLPGTAAAGAKAYGLTKVTGAPTARPTKESETLTSEAPIPTEVGSSPTTSQAPVPSVQPSTAVAVAPSAPVFSATTKGEVVVSSSSEESPSATPVECRAPSALPSDPSGTIPLPAPQVEDVPPAAAEFVSAPVVGEVQDEITPAIASAPESGAAKGQDAVLNSITSQRAASDETVATATRDGVAEKIAARLGRNAEPLESSGQRAQKTSLASNGQSLRRSSETLGTDVAKTDTRMFATASSPMPAPTVSEKMPFETAAVSFGGSLVEESDASNSIEQSAKQAVESVLKVADQVASTSQHSVKLQFSVGGEDLAVRVELRGDKVHTTFRADSPELCSALAHEWQAVSTVQSGDRTQRMADPVFTSASGTSTSTSTDSGAGHSRDQPARHLPTPAEEFGSLIRNSRAQLRAASQTIAKSAPTITTNSSSRRLQTFA